MILNADDSCNTLAFTWTTGSTQEWNIKVAQIECDAQWKPDDGCLQWFTGTTGTIYSYNYQGGTHLSNQQYSNCIRAEQGYCSIAYSSCTTTSFKMGNPSTASPAFSLGDACVTDYVLISDGATSVGGSPSTDRYCGGTQLQASTTATDTTVYTNRQPYQVGVVIDSTEVDTATAGEVENSLGFCIDYVQALC